MRKAAIVLTAWLLLAAFGLGFVRVSFAGVPAQVAQKLRVGVLLDEPTVIKDDHHYRGFSIDYWEKVAEVLGVAYEYVPFRTADAALQALESHAVDLVIGQIELDAEREQKFDLTHDYLETGLQILTRPPHQQSFGNVIAPLLAPAIGQVLGLALLFAIIMAHVIYFVEHRSGNQQFQQGYLRDIWEALWFLLIIVATGEYGDKEARTPIRRVVTVAFWLLGVLFIAQFTATVTSSLTVQTLTGEINSPEDLPGRRIVAIGEFAADYLNEQNIRFTRVDLPGEAYGLLEKNEMDAVVGPAPQLQYYALNAGNGKVAIAGPVFTILPLGMALPLDSPLRKPINEAILRFNEDGTRREIVNRWFGDYAE